LPPRAPLLPKLRGYFAEFLNKGSLEHLRILFSPTCVGLRYGHKLHSLEVFLGSMIRVSLCPKDSSSHLGVKTLWIYLEDPPTCLNRDNHRPADLSLLRYPIVQTHNMRFRNFNRIPIAYAFRPRLRVRLTLSGLTLLRKP
jgi:hypothetical protein